MITQNFREVVFPVEDAVEIIKVEGRGAERIQAVDLETRNSIGSVVDGGIRHAFSRSGVIGNEQRVRRNAGLFKDNVSGKSKLRDVDGGWVGNVGPLNARVGAGNVTVIGDELRQVLNRSVVVAEVVNGKLILVADVVINFVQVLVRIKRRDGVKHKVAARSGEVRQRIVVEQANGIRTPAAARNDAVLEDLPGQGIFRLLR